MKLEERMRRSIKQRGSNVILRAELDGMGSASQVSEALRALQGKGILVRIGTGVYSKTRKSSVTGATIPAGSLETLATEALEKMGVKVSAGTAASAYNSGETTQLPGTFIANTGRRRISRKIAVGGRTVKYENNYGRIAADA
jgi:pyridoxine 5'-phosphate synthase PdxJ